MTREEEIDKIAIAFAIDAVIDKDTCNPESKRGLIYTGFTHGAMWSDSHPHWISVEDELPPTSDRDDESEDCLIVDEDGDMNVGYYNKMDKTWFSCDGYILGVTYWMPLPEAPRHIIDANKKVDRVIGTADHIKTALDVLNKKGGEK